LLKNSYSENFSMMKIAAYVKMPEIVSLEVLMRGTQDRQASMLALTTLESRIPSDHPLRRIKAMADQELSGLSRVFDRMYSNVGRPSVAPEKILKSLLLIALYSVRSERQFCEQLDYNLLFRWFLDMELMEESFDATVFSKNRERLMEHEVGRLFFEAVVGQARGAGLMSDDHFTVDGTLIEAWASLKSFRPKGEERSGDKDQGDPGNRWVDFHGEKRSNDTHESSTDPDSRLIRKGPGKEAKLCYGAHALMENRNGLLVDLEISQATGSAEREAAKRLLKRQRRKRLRVKSLGADKGYDTDDFVGFLRGREILPHVAANLQRRGGSAIDGRTTRHTSYSISQRIRKRVEEIFGWMKTVGGFRKTRFRGTERTQLAAWWVGAAYNLLRMAKLVA
jgi:transposase